MCEFCIKHGEGKKWYLQAKNYSADLLNDLRRKDFANFFFKKVLKNASRDLKRLETLSSYPQIIQVAIKSYLTWKQKREHFGQVVPFEEIEKIFSIVNKIVLLPCLCRTVTRKKEVWCCLGISISPEADSVISSMLSRGYQNGPDNQGLQKVEKKEALKMIQEFEKEGLVHSVWTIITPFIAGICNCDRSDCLALKVNITYNLKMMFRSEYIARVDLDKCTGCRECMKFCQFGALTYSPALNKAVIDLFKCYGCGVCRTGCTQGAIFLKERKEEPAVAQLW